MSQNRQGGRSKNSAMQESEQLIAGRNPVLEALRSENLPDTVYLSGNSGVLYRYKRFLRSETVHVRCRCRRTGRIECILLGRSLP